MPAAGGRRRADALTDADWNLVSEMVDAVERRWHEPDHGIWEIRGHPRHHVYSKVMCWLTVDRALSWPREYGREAPPGWVDAARRDLRRRAASTAGTTRSQSYTAAYDGTDLDAASL